jgi:rubrerythrin
MKLTTEDMIKQKLLDAQESVRDYQEYSGKTNDKEVDETFKQFAEESGYQAQKLQELLKRYEIN